MKPFLLTAHLHQGVVLDTRIGVGLDSLLASEIRRKAKQQYNLSGQELDGGLRRIDNTVTTVELPLGKCVDVTDANRWHWLATCAVPVNHQNLLAFNLPDVHTIIQTQHISKMEESVKKLPKNVSDKSGRWRGRMIPVPSVPAAKLLWSGVGDVDEIFAIVSKIRSVGQRRRAGEGSILRWEIKETSHTSQQAGHLNPVDANCIGRPCFGYCIQELDVSSESTYQAVAGVRPPYWHIGTQEEVLLPLRRS